MCITKPRRGRVKASSPGASAVLLLNGSHLIPNSKAANESKNRPSSEREAGQVKDDFARLSPSVVGSADTDTCSNRPTIANLSVASNHDIIANATLELLASSSPGTKIVDDSWPALESVYDEIEVQKSQLEAEKSVFSLAASEAYGVRKKKSSMNKRKHDLKDIAPYNDRSQEKVLGTKVTGSSSNKEKLAAFPLKLHRVLSEIEADGLSDVVGWQPHGRAFLVRDPERFKTVVLPDYLHQKPATFLRQINLYGFQRMRKGPDRDGYYHEYFLRGLDDLTAMIPRTKTKGTGIRQAFNPDTEPNLYRFGPVGSGSGFAKKNDETPSFVQKCQPKIGGQCRSPADAMETTMSLPAIVQPSPIVSTSVSSQLLNSMPMPPPIHPVLLRSSKNSATSDGQIVLEHFVHGEKADGDTLSSPMYNAYLDSEPTVPLPQVSGGVFLERNAASFVRMSTSHLPKPAPKQNEGNVDTFYLPPPPTKSYFHRQVTPPELMVLDEPKMSTVDQAFSGYDVSMDDVKPASSSIINHFTESNAHHGDNEALDEFSDLFGELDKDLAFLFEEGQSVHLDDDISFGHLLDQAIADL